MAGDQNLTRCIVPIHDQRVTHADETRVFRDPLLVSGDADKISGSQKWMESSSGRLTSTRC